LSRLSAVLFVFGALGVKLDLGENDVLKNSKSNCGTVAITENVCDLVKLKEHANNNTNCTTCCVIRNSASPFSCSFTLHKEDISNSKDVIEMKISGTKIKNVTTEAFENLIVLKYLDLSLNDISVLRQKVFHPLNFLYHLNLSFNNIFEIRDDLFQNNINLVFLDLSNNQIAEVGQEVFKPENLPKLKEVYFENNTCVNQTFGIGKYTELIIFLKSELSENCRKKETMDVVEAQKNAKSDTLIRKPEINVLGFIFRLLYKISFYSLITFLIFSIIFLFIIHHKAVSD
jgi:hypothetical protein